MLSLPLQVLGNTPHLRGRWQGHVAVRPLILMGSSIQDTCL